jgi:hypothetical protein
MDILPASKSSDWWTVITDNNPSKGANLKDGINGPAFEKLQAQLVKAKTVPEQIGLWQAFLKTPANINDTGMPIAKKALNTWMTDGKMPSNVQAALAKDPLASLPALAQAQLTYDKTDPASVKTYETALKNTYGNLKKADGTPAFTPAYLESVAAGTIPQATFDANINNIAVKAATADLKAQGISLADVGGAEGLASSGKLAEYLNDPTKLALAYTSTPTTGSTVTGGEGTDTVPNEGITALGPYSGSISEVNTPAKMKQAVDNYNPNKGVYRAPSLDASGKLVANSTSPYSNILNGMLSGYKNPYAADYTNQLKMPETPDLTNIKKPFENNPTSKDLLKLANSAGQPYDPNAITSLSPALSKIYQPSITNSAGKATKPGAPDTTNTTLPVVPKAGEPIVTDTSAGQVVNPPVVNPPVVNPPVVNPPVVNPPIETPQTSYSSADYSPELKAALATRAITDAQNATVGDTITANDKLAKGIVASANQQPAVVTTPGKLPFQENDGVVVSADERAKNLEAARIAQEALAKHQAKEKSDAEQAGLVALANQQAADKIAADKAAADAAEWEYNSNKAREETAAWEQRQKAEVERQAEVNRLAALARNPDGGPSSLAPSNNITSGPQQVTLAPDTVVSTPGWGVLARDTVAPISSAQTVALPPSGPQPISPSNGGPSSYPQVTVNPTPAQNAGIVGTIDPATLSVANMNSNAGGLPSLMGPFQNTVQPAVTQQPAAGTNTVVAPNSSQKPAVIGDPWDNMNISQEDYYENYY